MAQALMTFEEVGSRRRGSHRGGIHQHYVLDEPGRRLLLARYDGTTATLDDLMRTHFGARRIPRWKVRHWAQQLGLARQKEPPWTMQEIAYLEQSLHRLRLAEIARHLGRTTIAMQLKAKRLGLRKTSEGYTMRGLCLGLGVDHHTVSRWIEAGWLKGTRRHSERERDLWYFADQDIRAFVRAHPAEIDPRRVDWLWLVDVLLDCGHLAAQPTRAAHKENEDAPRQRSTPLR
jgi:hypothetical protein